MQNEKKSRNLVANLIPYKATVSSYHNENEMKMCEF